MAIRWRKKDTNQLSIYVRKFNAKITRLEKQNPDIASAGLYPQRISVSDLKSRIFTRKDFNREIKAIDRFFKSGAADIITTSSGIKITKYELNEAKIYVRRINKRRKDLRDKSGISDFRAKELNLNYVSLEDKLNEIKLRIENMRKKAEPDMSNEMQNFKNFLIKLHYESSDEWFDRKNDQYYLNYLEGAKNELGAENAQKIKDLLEKLGITGYQLYLINLKNDLTDFDYVYGADKVEERIQNILEQIPITFKEVMEDDISIM